MYHSIQLRLQIHEIQPKQVLFSRFVLPALQEWMTTVSKKVRTGNAENPSTDTATCASITEWSRNDSISNRNSPYLALVSLCKLLLDEEGPEMGKLPRAGDAQNHKLDQDPSNNAAVGGFGLVTEFGLPFLLVMKC